MDKKNDGKSKKHNYHHHLKNIRISCFFSFWLLGQRAHFEHKSVDKKKLKKRRKEHRCHQIIINIVPAHSH